MRLSVLDLFKMMRHNSVQDKESQMVKEIADLIFTDRQIEVQNYFEGTSWEYKRSTCRI